METTFDDFLRLEWEQMQAADIVLANRSGNELTFAEFRRTYQEHIDAKIITDVLEATKEDLRLKRKIKFNQERMIELADYKYKKTLAYKNIMKRIVYSCIIIIGITYAINLPFFPSLIGKGFIILIISYNVYSLMVEFIWNFRRDSKYWDKFNQISGVLDARGDISLSRWEHNKKSLGIATNLSCDI